MNQLTESLKRLFNAGNISEEKVFELYSNNMISETDKQYILAKDK